MADHEAVAVTPVAITFDGAEASEPLLAWAPDCVSRSVPGTSGATWVHGYTAADVARWTKAASNLAQQVPEARGGDGKATIDAMRLAQVLVVCRRGPGSDARTFRVELGGEKQVWRVMQAMPGLWIEQICRESDALTLADYHRPGARKGQGKEVADTLHEALADPEFRGHLEFVLARFLGCTMAETEVPISRLLELVDRDAEARAALAGVLSHLAV